MSNKMYLLKLTSYRQFRQAFVGANTSIKHRKHAQVSECKYPYVHLVHIS